MSTSNHKSAFAVRCHTFGKAEARLYDFAKEYFGKENTFLVLNTEESLDVPSEFNKIIFNAKKFLVTRSYFGNRIPDGVAVIIATMQCTRYYRNINIFGLQNRI